jgi:uncharacterized protein YybS (DUF2232 family)
MNRIQTRALVEGAIFAAITVVIGVVRFYIPVIALISIVWSVPTILIAFRHGFKVSINSVIVSSVLVAIMTQPIEGVGFIIGFGLPGIIMGYLLQKKQNAWVTIFITGIVLAVCSVASIYLGMLAIGTDIVKSYSQIFNDMKSAYTEVANTMKSIPGMNPEAITKGTVSFEKSLELMKLILPGGILLSGIVMSFINFKLARLVLRKINYFIEDVKPFSMWRLSNKWTIFLGAMLLYVIAELTLVKLPQLYAFTMNIYTITIVLFVIFGLSVTKFFLDKYSVPKVVKGIIIFFLLFTFSNITMLIGIFDMVFDLRKLRNKSSGDVS